MALQKTINYKGLVITNAYCKLTNLSGNKNGLFYTIGVFANKEQSQNSDNKIKSFSYSFLPIQDENSSRWDKQCYENAKTQEDFKDFIDLLDE